MIAAHMFVQYPWEGIINDTPEVTGRGFPQTDHAEAFYPTSVFATNAIRSGQLPMWQPYSFNGVPAIDIGVGSGLLYPPRLALMTVLSPIRQHDLILFTHLLLAGLGMYSLLRVWGANVLGSVLGAVAWQLNGQQAIFLTFELIGIASVWFPVMLLCATLAIKRQSLGWALVTGAALGMSILAGIYTAYISSWVLTCWYGILAILTARKLFLNGERQNTLICLSLPLISAVVAATLSAPAWLSLFGSLPYVHRSPVGLEEQLREAFRFSSFLRALIWPKSFAGLQHKTVDFASFGFLGTPALLLAIPGVFRRAAPVMLASILAVFSIGIILGFRPLIILLRLLIPYFGAMHFYLGYFLLGFAIAVLAAFGMTKVAAFLKKFPSGRISWPIFGCAAVIVESVSLIIFLWIVNPQQPVTPQWLFPETPVLSNLKARQGPYHILPIYLDVPSGKWTFPMLPGKESAVFDLRSGSGYEEILPIWTATLWRSVQLGGPTSEELPLVYRPDFHSSRLPITFLKNISVGLFVSPAHTTLQDINGNDPLVNGDVRLVYSERDGQIYEVEGALPRAFIVPAITIAANEEQSLSVLADPLFDARKAAIVMGAASAATTDLPTLNSPGAAAEGTATIVSDRLNNVEVEVNTLRRAMLVLNDSWDPGWKAYVDGQEQPVLRVNYAFRGVVVSEGKHRINFSYRPRPLLIGIAISSVSFALLIVWFVGRGLWKLRTAGSGVRGQNRIGVAS
jgi:hypothetical protein